MPSRRPEEPPPPLPPPPPSAAFDRSLPAIVALDDDGDAGLVLAYWSQYVGRKVCKLFQASSTLPQPQWFFGQVVSVSVENGQPYFMTTYSDGDQEELFWEDMKEWMLVPGSGPDLGPVVHQPPPYSPVQQQQRVIKQEAGTLAADGPAALLSTAPRKRQQRSRSRSPVRGASPGTATPAKAMRQPVFEARPSTAAAVAAPRKRQRSRSPRRAASPESPTPVRNVKGRLEEEPRGVQGRDGARAARKRLDMDTGAGVSGRSSVAHPPPDEEAWPAGHLHRIQLQDFMSHKNTEVLFGRHVTFISGHNGSGKSALLQGLQACLGATARGAGRGTNLGGWVRTGRRRATVTVEIWNYNHEEDAADATWEPYRPEIFGYRIRVQRRIVASEPDADGKRTAHSSYHMYDAAGVELRQADLGRTVVREIEAMTTHFSMDASNPLIIITQDMARKFQVQENGDHLKYKFYMEGTMLAATRDELAVTNHRITKAGEMLKEGEEELAAKQAELEELEAKQARLRQMAELRELVEPLERTIAWADVQDMEANVEQQQEAIASHPRHVATVSEHLARTQQKLQEEQDKEAALREEVNLTRQSSLDQRMADAKAELKALERSMLRARAEQNNYQQEVENHRYARESLQGELQNLQKQADSEDVLRVLQEHEQKVHAQVAEVEALTAQRAPLDERRRGVRATLKEAEAGSRRAAVALDQHRSELASLLTQRAELLADKGQDTLAALWGKDTARLSALIGRDAARFSRKPIGPVGYFLRRKCPETHARVLEFVLKKSIMNVWLVNSRADYQHFCTLAREAGFREDRIPRALIAPFKAQPHAHPPQCVGPDGRTWLRIIDLVQVSNDLNREAAATVINCLLDEADAATTVITEDSSSAREAVFDHAAGPGVRIAYDLRCTSYEVRGLTMMTQHNTLQGPLRLGADARAQVAHVDEEVGRVQAAVAAAEASRAAATKLVAELQKEAEEIAGQLAQLMQQAAVSRSQLKTLQSQAPKSSEDAMNHLMSQLNDNTQQLVDGELRLSELQDAVNNLQPQVKEAKETVRGLSAKAQQYLKKREELVDLLQAQAEKVAATQSAVEQLAAALAAARAKEAQGQEGLRQLQAALKTGIQMAEQVCSRQEGEAARQRVREARRLQLQERLRDKRSGVTAQNLEERWIGSMQSKALEDYHKDMVARIRRAEAEAGGNLEALNVQVAAAQKVCERKSKGVESVRTKLKMLRRSRKRREDKYLTLRQAVEQTADRKFRLYMARRNWYGEVLVNHDAETLQLTVRKAGENKKVTQLSTLSGGERSYTTSSFLIAMGEVCESPFRAMDEYDVFMDNLNRTIATQSLLEFAWLTMRSRQLVLLSPQDVTTLNQALEHVQAKCQSQHKEVPGQDFLKVIALADPRLRAQQQQQ